MSYLYPHHVDWAVWGVMAQQIFIRASNSNSGFSVQQSVGLSPGCYTFVPEQDTIIASKWVPVRADIHVAK